MDKERKAFYWNFLGNKVEPSRHIPDPEGSQTALLAVGTVSWSGRTTHMEILGAFFFFFFFEARVTVTTINIDNGIDYEAFRSPKTQFLWKEGLRIFVNTFVVMWWKELKSFLK